MSSASSPVQVLEYYEMCGKKKKKKPILEIEEENSIFFAFQLPQ